LDLLKTILLARSLWENATKTVTGKEIRNCPEYMNPIRKFSGHQSPEFIGHLSPWNKVI
jgi:hypothetical protein